MGQSESAPPAARAGREPGLPRAAARGAAAPAQQQQNEPGLLDAAQTQAARAFWRARAGSAPLAPALAVAEALSLPPELAPALGKALGGSGEAVGEAAFVEAVGTLARGTTLSIREVLFRCYDASAGSDEVALSGLFRLALAATLAAGGEDSAPAASADVSALARGLRQFASAQALLEAPWGAQGLAALEPGSGSAAPAPALELVLFSRWATQQVPDLQEGLVALVASRSGVRAAKPRGALCPGLLHGETRSEVATLASAFALACSDARCQNTAWQPLYSSQRDGLAFDALAKGLVGYEGPTVLLVRDQEGLSFGALTGVTWREEGQFYGDAGSQLLALWPDFALRRARTDGSAPGTGNFQYLKVRGRQGLQGLGLGGDELTPRLLLDRDFEQCRAGALDLTYEEGALRGPGRLPAFEPHVIEAWGLGGDAAAAAQAAERQDLDRLQSNRRKVDKKALAGNAFDREFLLGKTFAHEADKQAREGQ
jgi:hypothetical protein